jgi:hypothetical protein
VEGLAARRRLKIFFRPKIRRNAAETSARAPLKKISFAPCLTIHFRSAKCLFVIGGVRKFSLVFARHREESCLHGLIWSRLVHSEQHQAVFTQSFVSAT